MLRKRGIAVVIYILRKRRGNNNYCFRKVSRPDNGLSSCRTPRIGKSFYIVVKFSFDFYYVRIDLQDFDKETLNLSTSKFILTRKKENQSSIFLIVYIFILLALHVDVV